MGSFHGIVDVVHELERMRVEEEKQTALLERIALALEEQRPAD